MVSLGVVKTDYQDWETPQQNRGQDLLRPPAKETLVVNEDIQHITDKGCKSPEEERADLMGGSQDYVGPEDGTSKRESMLEAQCISLKKTLAATNNTPPALSPTVEQNRMGQVG